MRPFGPVAIVAACLGLLACGSSSKSTRSTTTYGLAAVTAYFPHHPGDRDNDTDRNDDDSHYLEFGHLAGPIDRRETVDLVKRYFVAAAAEDGAKACALLAPFVAESVAEVYEESLKSKTCASAMTILFRRHHSSLVAKHKSLQSPEVRVEGNVALVILEFPPLPEVRQIPLRRVNGTWTVLELLDNFLE